MDAHTNLEEEAEQLGALNIFEEFRLRNIEKLGTLLNDYDGDKEKLGKLLTQFIENGDRYWSSFSDIEENESEVYDVLSEHFDNDTVSKIFYPDKEEKGKSTTTGKEEIHDDGEGKAYIDHDNNSVNITTDNFSIRIVNPHIKRDGDVEGTVICQPSIGSGIEYDESMKLSRYGAREFSKQIIELNNLVGHPDEDELKRELKNAILARKTFARQVAREDDEEDGSPVVDESSELPVKVQKAIQIVDRKSDSNDEASIFDLKEEGIEPEIADKYTDYVLRSGTKVWLTEKGKEFVTQIEGMVEFSSEEEVEEYAEKVLETDPLTYYLESFEKVHIGDHLLKIWELVSALSAASSNSQIHSWAVGPSGKGKSHIKRSLVDYYLPSDSYAKPSSFSPQALYYLAEEKGSDIFKNKVLFIDEVDDLDNDEIIPMLRTLTDNDEDQMSRLTVEDQQSKQLNLEKPITVWFTSVQSINDEQLKNRFILTNPDGSSEQDEAVFEFQKKRLHRGRNLEVTPSEAPVIKKMISKIRSETGGLNLVTPFDVEWKQSFNRRLYPVFHTLLELITKIHYKNRHIENGYIVATEDDFELAARVWSRLVATTVAQVDKDALRLVEVLPESSDAKKTTSELAMELDGFSTKHVRDKAKQLMDTETLALINGQKDGGKWFYWAGRDRKRLADPDPVYKTDEEIMKRIIRDTDIEWDSTVKRSVTHSDCPVLETLNDLERTGTNLNEDNVNNDTRPNESNETQEESGSRKDEFISLYPEEEPREITEIVEEAKERFDVESEEQFKTVIHDKLQEDGQIFTPNPGMWMRL